MFEMTEQDGRRFHRISGPDLAKLLGVSSTTLTKFRREGWAVQVRRGVYDFEATLAAYVGHLRDVAAGRGGEDQVATLTGERARLAKEQADAQAIKNEVLRGDLVPAEAVERKWADVLRLVRSRILAAPARLRADLALSAGDAGKIDAELREALSELANGDG